MFFYNTGKKEYKEAAEIQGTGNIPLRKEPS